MIKSEIMKGEYQIIKCEDNLSLNIMDPKDIMIE
jgi:hypothetical protein